MSPRTHRFQTNSGLVVLHEESHALPVVDIELSLRTGAAGDGPEREGLTRLAWRAWRTGTKRLPPRAVEDAIARLGARLVIDVSNSLVRVRAVVIRRNLEPFLELLAHLLQAPAFRAKDVAQCKRETQADLVSLRDSDRALASRWFRRRLFGRAHPYGRSVLGSEASIRAMRRKDLADSWHGALVARNLVLGLAGDVSRSDAARFTERYFGELRRGRRPGQRIAAPRRRSGVHVVVVDKPDRTQCQMFLGTLGGRFGDPDQDALAVANTAFGGTLTSPLWQEVREKRGWSYGVSSRLGSDRQREAWAVHTFPHAEKAADCAALEMELVEQFIDDGVPSASFRLAKKYLINSHCFDLDTAAKRLENAMDVELFGLPADHVARYSARVRGVNRKSAHEAVKRRLSKHHLTLVVVGSAHDLAPRFERLPRIGSIEVVDYDAA